MIKLGLGGNHTIGLGLSLNRKFKTGGGGDALLAAMLAESPIIAYDNKNLGTFWADTAATTPATINGVVARQDDVSGNGFHRTQANLPNRPILRGTPTGSNLVVNGDFNAGTGWILGSGFSISGGKLTRINSGAAGAVIQAVPYAAGRVLRITYTIESITGTCIVGLYGSTNVIGGTRTTPGTYTDYLTVPAGGSSSIRINAITATTAFVLDSIEVRDASADAVSAPYFLHYDGVDDSLQIASVDLTGTDNFSACFGIRKLSDAVLGVSFGTNGSGKQSIYWYTPSASNETGILVASRGSALSSSVVKNVVAPATRVITQTARISTDTNILRLNGAQVATSTQDQGTGNFANAIMSWGRRSDGFLSCACYDYGGAFFPILKSGAGLDAIEAFVANRTGVTL